MEFKIKIADKKIFAKDISKIWKSEVDKIFEKIELLKIYWINFSQVRRLKNYETANFRLRIWNYRVLFDFDLEHWEIIIFRCLHRSKLY